MRKVIATVLLILMAGCVTSRPVSLSVGPIPLPSEYIKVIMELILIDVGVLTGPVYHARTMKSEAHCGRAVIASRVFNVEHTGTPYKILVNCYVYSGDKYA